MAERKRPDGLITGITLIAFGIIGVLVLSAFFIGGMSGWMDVRDIWPGTRDGGGPFFFESEQGPEDFSSLGEQVYYTGRGEDGRFIPQSDGIMHANACVDCHGRDGRGGTVRIMMGRFEAPDIRWEALAEEHEDEHDGHPPYDTEAFARALREGRAPGDELLDRIMPRWDMTEEEVDALVDYLKTL